MRKSVSELENILRSQDGLVYALTYEENEFLQSLAVAINNIKNDPKSKMKASMQIFVYSRPQGLYKVDLTNPTRYSQENVVKNVKNIYDAFNYIKGMQDKASKKQETLAELISKHRSEIEEPEEQDAPSVFVFKDLHMFFNDKDVIRHLRDLKETYKSPNYCPIFVTSPIMDLPPELEKIFTLFEFPLLTKEEITKLLGKTLREKFNLEQSKQEEIINSCVGLTAREIFRALAHSAAKNVDKDIKVTAEDVHEEKIQIIKKSGALDFIVPEHSLEDLGGSDNFKEWVLKVKEAMTPEAAEFGIPKPKGAMLVGVPGTSKTVSAEILASYLKVPLISLDMAKVMGSYVGQSERQISNALRICQSVAPCILLLDEMEKILGGVQSSNSTDSGTLSRVMSQLLNFLQKDDTNVITLMTSNDVSQLPPELTRTGRIDAQWLFDLPNKYERDEIIDIYLKKSKLECSSDNKKLAISVTSNFTGAEIKSMIKDAMINSFYRQKKNGKTQFSRILTKEDIEAAANNTVTVYKSSNEKIETFRANAKGKYLNASKSEKELSRKQKVEKDFVFDFDIFEKPAQNNSNILTLD